MNILLFCCIQLFLEMFLDLRWEVDELEKECLFNIAKTAMSSKIIGADADFFSEIVVNAALSSKINDPKGAPIYAIKNVNVLKAHGKSARESMFIEGYALNCTVASQQMPKKITNAKIACLDFLFFGYIDAVCKKM